MRTVWTNTFHKVEDLPKLANNKQVVIIINAISNTHVLVCDYEDGEDVDSSVKSILRALSAGCDCKYELLAKIGNTYIAK